MSEVAEQNARSASSSSDDELVKAAINGDVTSFEALVRRYRRAIVTVGRRITSSPDDAEDIAQTTFMKAFVALPGFRGRSSFLTWLNSIAKNESLMWMRKRARELAIRDINDDQEPTVPFELPDSRPDPESILIEKERRELLRARIDKLRPSCRMAIKLGDMEEKSVRTTALWLGITVAAVKSRRSRGHAALRAALARSSPSAFTMCERLPFTNSGHSRSRR